MKAARLERKNFALGFNLDSPQAILYDTRHE